MGDREGPAKMNSPCGKVNHTRSKRAMAHIANLIYVHGGHSFPGFASLIDRHSEQPPHGQAHISPPQQAPYQEAWIPHSDVDPVGT
jgi:hypothetical protein